MLINRSWIYHIFCEKWYYYLLIIVLYCVSYYINTNLYKKNTILKFHIMSLYKYFHVVWLQYNECLMQHI